MKKYCFFSILTTTVVFSFITVCSAQNQNEQTVQELQTELDSIEDTRLWIALEQIKDTLRCISEELQIPKDFLDRYRTVVHPLCEQGVILFDIKTSWEFVETDVPMLKEAYGNRWNWYFYDDTPAQNAKLVRNLKANKHLFRDGQLIPDAGKYWVLVE